MNKILELIEKNQIKRNIPKFRSGDYVEIKIWIMEGTKKRLQTFEGIVIAVKNRGINSSFTVRKHSYNENVERVFQTHSPVVNSITVKKFIKKVRKSKLYYLRKSIHKNFRIKKRFN